MNSLRVFLLCSLSHQRPCSLNRLQVTTGRPTGLGATLPLALGHWYTTQWNRPNSSTKATSQLNDKKKKKRLTKEEQEERKKKQKEVVEKFDEFIGERKLKDWKKLCDTIGLEGEFESIQSCREAIEAVHVNIYDVLDADEIIQAGGKARPQRFSTPYELSEYTKRAEKIYPRWMVIRSEPEGALLKNIDNPRLDEEWQRKKEEKKMRRKKEARVKREQEKLKGEKEGKQTETGNT
ncbi:hypothetical protein QBC45DRAFT_395586 [Copromyces sp. CBS 386.78]|nr:hypothetical protein QBC45DRAFT_395586 [Copromyces sp. CBS 386.78]